MRRLVLPLSIVLAGVIPLMVGRVLAGWLLGWLEVDALWGWVVGMVTAVFTTLLLILGWAIYRDELWHGLMHPIAFMGSVALLVIALLSLPALWGQLRLLAGGETAVGTVETLSTGIDYDSETNITNTLYYLTYRFATNTGESHSNRVQVAQGLYQSFREGEAIDIVYLPDKPGYSLPEIAIQPESRARRIFTFLLAVYGVLAETAVVMLLRSGNSNRFN